MIKVLNISMGESLGGIEYLESKYQKHIKGVDVLSPIKLFDEKHYYDLNTSRKNIFGKIKYNYRLYKFLKNNKYDIVHINSSVFLFSFQVAFISKLCGIKKIISHSHSIPKTNILKKVLICILTPLYNKMINIFLSCSTEASFNKKSIIIKNGIDISKYKFNKRIRNKLRKELNIESKKVYGHVGSFTKNKNQEFIIDLFNEIQKLDDSYLILIGEGENINKIKSKVNNLGLNDKVCFLENRNDVYKWLNVMDIFLFPSISEGLGLSIIESQTSGLPTFVSKNISDDANISNNFIRINSFDKEEWIKKIMYQDLEKRSHAYKDTINNNYDIKYTIKSIKKIYKDLIK